MKDLTFNELPAAISQLFEKVEGIEKILLQQKQDAPVETDELLNIQQAAKILNLSVPTIYGYVHRMEIPVSKKGKRLYFSKQELMQWVKDGRKKTIAEIKQQAIAQLKRNSP